MISEFKKFILRGNVLDLAVGVIIGAAFGKIVTSLVNDILMPPIGLALGGTDFSELKIVIQDAVLASDGTETAAAVAINYGMFIQTVIQFLIVAFCIFLVVKGFNKLTERMKKKEEEAPAAPAEPSNEEKLLTDIRDLLKAGR